MQGRRRILARDTDIAALGEEGCGGGEQVERLHAPLAVCLFGVG
jgi:hypothetical protein